MTDGTRGYGESSYSIWARGWTKDIEQRRDYLGNYLFGYYGQGTLLLGDDTLKMGAGVAQILSDAANGNPSKLIGYGIGYFLNPELTEKYWRLSGYGDNPEDGAMVQEGIDDFKKYNKNK